MVTLKSLYMCVCVCVCVCQCLCVCVCVWVCVCLGVGGPPPTSPELVTGASEVCLRCLQPGAQGL